MNIGSLCSRRIVTVDSACNLTQAAGLMREHHVGALVVTTESADGTRVTGVVTDRDLVIHVLAQGLDGDNVDIGDLANRQVASVSERDDLSHALVVMQEHAVRRLLVTNDAQQLIGIVSLDDLAAACASDTGRLAEVIRRGIDRETVETTPVVPPLPPLRIPAMDTAGWGNVRV
ncbi:MAG: CBS domain-containing protein [Pseudomonadota bacterium]|nr:CBS domain-containing protein [Pseudomonadota bacterium]